MPDVDILMSTFFGVLEFFTTGDASLGLIFISVEIAELDFQVIHLLELLSSCRAAGYMYARLVQWFSEVSASPF